MLTKEQKEEAMKGLKTHKEDTGSAASQIGLLSEEISKLQSHLKKNPKDIHSRRGLLKMVIKRKKLLKYLERKDKKQHAVVVKKVGLKSKTA
jgi:small subunit ribosomal protein S15